jgi:hypothetical protein
MVDETNPLPSNTQPSIQQNQPDKTIQQDNSNDKRHPGSKILFIVIVGVIVLIFIVSVVSLILFSSFNKSENITTQDDFPFENSRLSESPYNHVFIGPPFYLNNFKISPDEVQLNLSNTDYGSTAHLISIEIAGCGSSDNNGNGWELKSEGQDYLITVLCSEGKIRDRFISNIFTKVSISGEKVQRTSIGYLEFNLLAEDQEKMDIDYQENP